MLFRLSPAFILAEIPKDTYRFTENSPQVPKALAQQSYFPPRNIPFQVMRHLGMEKRPLRFSLPGAFFEGSRSGGREDCLSTRRSYGDGLEWRKHALGV